MAWNSLLLLHSNLFGHTVFSWTLFARTKSTIFSRSMRHPHSCSISSSPYDLIQHQRALWAGQWIKPRTPLKSLHNILWWLHPASFDSPRRLATFGWPFQAGWVHSWQLCVCKRTSPSRTKKRSWYQFPRCSQARHVCVCVCLCFAWVCVYVGGVAGVDVHEEHQAANTI